MAEQLCQLKKKGGGENHQYRIRRFGVRLYSGGSSAVSYLEIYADNYSSVSIGAIDSNLSGHTITFYDSTGTIIGERITITANSTYQIPSGCDYFLLIGSTQTSGTAGYFMHDIIVE